jgi:acyl carrier protein
MNEEYLQLVKETINEVILENGLEQVELYPETNILKETLLDSMGLAIVVTKLEEATGKDPFSNGFILFNTVNELATLYAN